LFNFDLKSKP